MTGVPPERARQVHDELTGLQRQVQDETPSLRTRHRHRQRRRRVRRSLRLLLAAVLIGLVAVVALDVGGVRSAAVDWYQEQIAEPAQGR